MLAGGSLKIGLWIRRLEDTESLDRLYTEL